MSLRLIHAVAETENLDDFHLARLLVLLSSADARKRTAESKARAIEGITKLAKLDFLVRYPTCLERALAAEGYDPRMARVSERERTSIESSMVRFRYGPWDARYRRWLGLLVARALVTVGTEGRTVLIGLTPKGREVAERFREDPLFQNTTARSDLTLKALGGKSGSALKNFVYAVVPEIVDMKWGEAITP